MPFRVVVVSRVECRCAMYSLNDAYPRSLKCYDEWYRKQVLCEITWYGTRIEAMGLGYSRLWRKSEGWH